MFILFIGIQYGYGQSLEVGINRTTKGSSSKTYQTAKLEEQEPITLPFWDDFSWSTSLPDITLWQDTVEISATMGIDPPTYNVAVFDGVKADGSPYSLSFGDFESGDTDKLTSNPIDLSGLTTTEKTTVYLSFFYQKQGYGELPDDEDGLRVEFLSVTESDTTWQLAIAPNIIKGSEVPDTNFHQIIHQVTGEEYFHNIFQFRIISTGRQTGPYDTWNIDYVYLNKGRSGNDTTFVDNAFNKPISFPLKHFTSLPIEHFTSNLSLEQETIRTRIHNLNSDGAVISGRALCKVKYYDSLKMDTLFFVAHNDSLLANSESLSNPLPYSSKDVLARGFLNFDSLATTASYAEIILKFSMNSKDSVPINAGFDPSSFFVNDTLVTTYYLDDYYAYDDGSAEKGAGVNSEGDNIAVQFPFLGSESSSLKGVYMYFPQVVGEAQNGKQIKINIWSHASTGPGAILSSRFLTIPKIEKLNDFYKVEFSNPVVVPDTFYIGWEQTSSDRVFIGLDKNINHQDKIWLNTTGEWELNINQIIGSLMLRPFFKEDAEVTSVDKLFQAPILIYPNPSTRYFKFDTHDLEDLSVMNLSGQVIQPVIRKEKNMTILDFDAYPAGIYIIKFINNNYIRAHRIILIK